MNVAGYRAVATSRRYRHASRTALSHQRFACTILTDIAPYPTSRRLITGLRSIACPPAQCNLDGHPVPLYKFRLV